MNIVEALDDPRLLGAAIKDPATFFAWRALFKALFGLPMDDSEVELYRAGTGRAELPTSAFAILWLVCGRRGGKSFAMALIAVFMGIFKDWRRFLAPGERAAIVIVAADREQAKVIRRYISGILENPMFSPHVESETADSIELGGSVVIEVATCSYRTVRGRSVCVALLDEVAFWRSESTANPDKEVWRAIRASMASFGSEGLAIIGSSPYAKRGLLYDGWRRYFGKPDARNLVWQAGTKVMNPTISDEFLAEEFEADPASAEAEYNAQFRSDIESYISREAIEACIERGCVERPPFFMDARGRYVGVNYFAFTDFASGSGTDSATLAIAHREGEISVLDCLREARPPFSPQSVVAEFAETLKSYRLHRVKGDRWSPGFVAEAFGAHGIQYEVSERTKSDLYRELLPLLNARRVDLVDSQRLISQLCSLERRTARGTGRDTIDAERGAPEDLANAAAGALVNVSGVSGGFNLENYIKAYSTEADYQSYVEQQGKRSNVIHN